LHAGDVCAASVLEELSAYAPVHAIIGNNDGPDVGAWGAIETTELNLGGMHDPRRRAQGGSAGATSAPVPGSQPRDLRALTHSAASR
jgi:uncharacterized protein